MSKQLRSTPSGRTLRSASIDNFPSTDMQQWIENMKTEIIRSVKDEIKVVNDKLSSLEIKMDNVERALCLLKDKQDSQEKEIVRLTGDVNYLKSELPSELLNEFQLRARRSKNVVMSGVPETNSGSIEERRRDDESQVEDILNTLGLPSTSFNILRLGRALSNNHNRLLRVAFRDEETRNEVFHRATKLHSHAEFNRVYSI